MVQAVALDTNVLVLLIVGLTSKNYIQRHSRTRQFTKKDFELLRVILASFSDAVVTPTTLAELSNLLDEGYDPMRLQIWSQFKSLVKSTQELYVASGDLSDRDEFIRLGLADCSMLELARQGATVLSTD